MITGEDRLKILDFGLATLAGQTGASTEGVAVGTSPYMSPEQIRGEASDGRADVWSLGVVLYQMLTGEVPFEGDHESAVFYSILHVDPARVSARRDDVPDELDGIVTKALSKSPGDRYQSIDGMIDDLEAAKIELLGSKAPFSPGPVVLPGPGRKLKIIGIPIVLALIVFGWWQTREFFEGSPMASIAVLPLVNLAADNENEFFVDGLTEELISQLAQIKSLKVISRTSVMRFKNTDQSPKEIARQLDVSTILEGSVLWTENEVRISVQLIDGVNEGLLWADSYVSDVGDVLALQRKVAMDVASQARVELTEQERERLSESPVVNAQAYELYLMGRFHWNQRTTAGLDQAMEYYRRAIAVDPDYGLAYAGLAETQILKATWIEGIHPVDVYPAAREMAVRALEIDPNLSGAHAVLGAVAHEYDWKWDKAEKELLRAIEINPNNATAHQWYGELLATLGRLDEAVGEAKLAQGLDPLSLIINCMVSFFQVLNGETEAGLDRVEDTDPFFPPLHMIRHFCYDWIADETRSAESWTRYHEVTAITAEQKQNARALRAAYEAGDLAGFYREAIEQMTRRYEESYAPPSYIAGFCVLAGEPDAAMAWLERGYRTHGALMYSIPRDGRFVAMRDDPRFVDLMRRMNLTYWHR
jgi:serine/threonine-protein kinase